MKESKFNFALVLSIMVLLVFSYISFLGLVYWAGGEIIKPIIITVAFLILLLICVLLLRKFRFSRFKRVRIVGQIFMGIITLCLFAAAAFPFTNFIRVIQDSEEINGAINEIHISALNLDKSYKTYVDQRLKNYEDTLTVVFENKARYQKIYQEVFAGCSPDKLNGKIAANVKSLKRRIYPDSVMVVVNERHAWLDEASKVSIWNPLMAQNLNEISKSVDGNIDNYKQLSSKFYKGEDKTEFVYDDFEIKLKTLVDEYKNFSKPTILAMIVSLITFVLVLLPYLLEKTDIAGVSRKKTELLFDKGENKN